MKKGNSLFILTLTSLMLFSCGKTSKNTGEWKNITTTEYFNTSMTLKYFKNSKITYPDNYDNDIQKLYLDRVAELHKAFDRHYYYDNEDGSGKITSCKTINDSYGTGKEIACSDELYFLLKEGVECTKLSNGYFNFFSGELVDFWENTITAVLDTGELEKYDPYYNEEKKLLVDNYAYAMPSVNECESLLTFNDEKKTVIFNTLEDKTLPDGTILERSKNDSLYRPEITSGGIGKGIATDYIKETLVSNGYKDGWLSSGSSSMTLLSNPKFTETGKQKISFADPRNTLIRSVAFSLELKEECNLSTSGNYTFDKSYHFEDNGKVIYRHHIVNPYSGENAQYHRSITLISTTFSAGELDALSTAVFNLTTENALAFRKDLLNAKPGYDLEMIFMDSPEDDDQSLIITSTSNFDNSLTLSCEGGTLNYAS